MGRGGSQDWVERREDDMHCEFCVRNGLKKVVFASLYSVRCLPETGKGHGNCTRGGSQRLDLAALLTFDGHGLALWDGDFVSSFLCVDYV